MNAARKPNSANTTRDRERFRNQFKKTQLCSFFQKGWCRYGDDCAFAHGSVEVEHPPDLTKTSLCTRWMEGSCKLAAANCRFAHGKQDLRLTPHFMQERRGHSDSGNENDAANLASTASSVLRALGLPCDQGLPRDSPQSLSDQQLLVSSPLGGEHSIFDAKNPADPYIFARADGGLTEYTSATKSMGSTRWDPWEGDTVAGESSSEDDSNSSPCSYPAPLSQPLESVVPPASFVSGEAERGVAVAADDLGMDELDVDVSKLWEAMADADTAALHGEQSRVHYPYPASASCSTFSTESAPMPSYSPPGRTPAADSVRQMPYFPNMDGAGFWPYGAVQAPCQWH